MYADDQIELLAVSGWNRCGSIRDTLERLDLPVPTAEYLRSRFPAAQWKRAAQSAQDLRHHFRGAGHVDEATFGVLLVPDPDKLDTRTAVPQSTRRDQPEITSPDFVDPRLPDGKLVVAPGADWTMVATVTGSAGIFLGSYHDIRSDNCAGTYVVGDTDTRDLMVRQLWGARVLQSGQRTPDSNARDTWTFTVFPGEDPTDGDAPSGTVLHGRVRFRLGKPDRAIAVVRVCPAIVVA
jgi:hypothetical protein